MVSETAPVESRGTFFFFQELTFTEPLSFSNFLRSVNRLPFRSQHTKDSYLCALSVVVQRKVCTENRTAVACWSEQWRAGPNSGLLFLTLAYWSEQWRADPNSGVLVSTVTCWSEKWRAGPNSGMLFLTVACWSEK